MSNLVRALCRRVAAAETQLFVSGGQTKPALLNADAAQRVSVDFLPSGVYSYTPTEFLITAAAGTKLAELQYITSEHGQYLPWDPVLLQAGATLGGTIAAGLSGPGQLLHGRLRDFVMEIECIDGLGRCVRGGGKVVKNAAGFDIPKLMVGSCGRLGIITEATLKVLPRPPASVTIAVQCDTLKHALAAAQQVARQPLPLAAVVFRPGGELFVRFAGPAASLPRVVRRARDLLQRDCREINDPAEQAQWWQRETELGFADDGPVFRVVHSPRQLASLVAASEHTAGLRCCSIWSVGAESWWTADRQIDLPRWDQVLRNHHASAVQILGRADRPLFLGEIKWLSFAQRIRHAVDPRRVFPDFVAGV